MLLQNDPFFNAVFNRLVAGESPGGFQQAPMDAYRRGSDVWVHIDLPGIAADSIDISVERNVLTVAGERFWDRREGDQVYLSDRSQGRFRRQVHLGDGLDVDAIEADHADGVLTLRIPVAEAAKPRRIAVQVNTPAIESESAPAAG